MKQSLQEGDIIGSYRVDKRIGDGGMGAVYLATHTLIGRKAAIKVLLPQFSHNDEVVQRFFNEARATTAIEHAGIVQVFDYGHERGSAFIVMELLQGETLEARLQKSGRLSIDEALRITRQIASALAAAHAQGVVHRDLKPENVFLVPDPEIDGGERAKVLDFGIAKLASADRGPTIKTRVGSVLGTPWYMAPEQCSGAGEIDHRADIYSLGCVLYHLVCARPPFVAAGAGDILASHLRELPPSPRTFEPTIPVELETLILRALAKAPGDRFATMDEFASQLAATYRTRITGVGAQTGEHGGVPVALPGRDTTLSGSASQRMTLPSPAPRRRIHMLLAAGLITAAASAAAVVAVGKYTQGLPESSKANVSAVAAPPAPKPPPALRSITIAISSKPPGASVVRVSDGVIVGQTPYNETATPTAGKLVFRLEKTGFADRLVELSGTEGGAREVSLVAKAAEKKADSPPQTPPASTKRKTRPKVKAKAKPDPKQAPPVAPKSTEDEAMDYR